MRRRTLGRAFAALLAFLLLAALPVRAEAARTEPDITEAQAAYLMDSAGNTLFELNADARSAPASITKIMTAIVALEEGIDLKGTVTVTPTEFQADAQVAGFSEGSTASIQDLMDVMLVFSANDAAVLVAREVGGTEDEFAKLMNEKAAELGMDNTHFTNSHGLLDDDHYSTARDLAIMGRYALENFPMIAKLVTTPEVTVEVNGSPMTFETTDALMELYGPLQGIKTGLTENGSAFLGSAYSKGITLYSCVLDCATKEGRFTDTKNLFEWAFETFVPVRIATAGVAYYHRPALLNPGYSIPVGPVEDVTGYVWPYGNPITISYTVTDPTAPVLPGAPTGCVMWVQDGRTIGVGTYQARAIMQRTQSFGPLASELFYQTEEVMGA